MPEPSSELARLVGSRICHDLISPIGAISNGLELLSMVAPPGTEPEELALIEHSARAAAARIRLFRLAFGATRQAGKVAADELRAILADVTADSRLDVALRASGDVPRVEAQFCCLAILCFETALPRGGLLTADWNDARWRIASTAEPRHADSDLWRLLTSGDPVPDVTPAQVQFRILADCAHAEGRPVQIDDDADALVMTI
ncbi:hypothetical protein ROJ8625_01856 [Roseivivax jejudonensis]|uniref:Histidine phosphotransferase ChpT C-terminal domain-containing protein n=1 Tax=Roseivivax jejudonensis TaxID=1529041 RepID=A0A1X6Z3B3_9RHOB|nr:histidine phosphotransferase family protein [Roseivivax jejudonensis]SLN39580.1 hypothetical protein ROJ8625_01856 [Roseivivax jejudonensis]